LTTLSDPIEPIYTKSKGKGMGWSREGLIRFVALQGIVKQGRKKSKDIRRVADRDSMKSINNGVDIDDLDSDSCKMDLNTAIEPKNIEGLGWYDSDEDTEEERDNDTENEMVDNVAVI
jgi:hypothetical protein